MTGPNYPEATNVSYPDAAKVPGIGHQIEMLERGIVTASSTDISLLGIDLLGIRQFKIVTTLDTWLCCGGIFW